MGKRGITVFSILLAALVFLAVRAFAWPVPDTGVTKCYDDSGEISCPGSGEPFYGQDGNYTINPPSYTKLDSNGHSLPDSAATWAMVRDNVTRLIWEVKTDDGSIHDKDNIYTWQDAKDVFIAELNAEQFGSYSNWRLPTPQELTSITMMGKGSYPAADTAYFPNCRPSDYWSGSIVAAYPFLAWEVGFVIGDVDANEKANSDYVRAVRGEQGWSPDRFIPNGDGTVTDTSTGLMWQQQDPGSTYNWQGALAYCENLLLAGYDDWRLPNPRELQSIVEYSKSEPAIDTTYFLNARSSDYWSCTSRYHDYVDTAWYVGFSGGDSYCHNKTANYPNRCVRGGQNQILGHLVVLAPTQGSVWTEGDLMSMRWDTAGIAENVEISISRQGGKSGTFETIQASTSNDGLYDWTVTGPGSFNCMLRIEPLGDPSKGATQGLFAARVILYVDPYGSCAGHLLCSQTIEGAINAAGDGDSILVQQGDYAEAIVLNEAKSLKLLCGRDTAYNPSEMFSTANALQIKKGTMVVERLVLVGE